MEEAKGKAIEKWSDDKAAPVRGSTNSGERDIADRFIDLRESTGMNRKDFAEYLGIPYRTMQDWERGVSQMPNYVFALIEFKVKADFPDLIRRGLEDQIEQNDNQLDGIINNLPEETVAEKEAKSSVVEKLKTAIRESEAQERKPKVIGPDRELC